MKKRYRLLLTFVLTGRRRAEVLGLTAGECMKGSPRTIPPEELAPAALQLMEALSSA